MPTRHPHSIAARIALLSTTLFLTACSAPRATAPATTASTRPALPLSAQPVAELKDLSFLAGRWVGVAPRASIVNEEHWMTPRGNAMVGTFRQVRRDGKTSFVEVSQIEATPDGIVLRLRHLHGSLEVPDNRQELSLFRLKSATPNRAEFTGTESSKGIAAMIYTLSDDRQVLTQELVFDPKTSKEQNFKSVYHRELN